MSDNDNSDPIASTSGSAHTGHPLGFFETVSSAQVSRWGHRTFYGALAVLALAYAAYFLTFHGESCCDPAAWGQFGDYIGGVVNPVLGLLTLLGLAFTVWLQMRQVEMGRTQLQLAHKQLELSRDELRATREELARSTKAQSDAAAAMNGQLEQARLAAQAQLQAADHLQRSAQIAGLSEGIRLAQHHLANMEATLRRQADTSPFGAADPRLADDRERISWLEIRAREGFWSLFEKVVDDARTEKELARD